MSIKKRVCVMCFFLLFSFSSCALRQTETGKQASDPVGTNQNSDSFIMRYDVYQQGATSDKPDEFSVAMASNPINTKMENDLLARDISNAHEAQIFFDKYLERWKNELSHSLKNLKKYCSKKDSDSLDMAQTDWENSIRTSNAFDREFIAGKEFDLGTQYVSSALLYTIDQYRTRAFHVKYMTYLAENHVMNIVPQQEQVWNKFHEID